MLHDAFLYSLCSTNNMPTPHSPLYSITNAEEPLKQFLAQLSAEDRPSLEAMTATSPAICRSHGVPLFRSTAADGSFQGCLPVREQLTTAANENSEFLRHTKLTGVAVELHRKSCGFASALSTCATYCSILYCNPHLEANVCKRQRLTTWFGRSIIIIHRQNEN